MIIKRIKKCSIFENFTRNCKYIKIFLPFNIFPTSFLVATYATEVIIASVFICAYQIYN